VRSLVRLPIVLEGGAGSLEHWPRRWASTASGLGTMLVFSDYNLVKIDPVSRRRPPVDARLMRLAEPLRGPRLALAACAPPTPAVRTFREWTTHVSRGIWRPTTAGRDRASLKASIENANAHASTVLLGIVVTAEERHIGNIKRATEPGHRRGVASGTPPCGVTHRRLLSR
jgi:hypothetical protein